MGARSNTNVCSTYFYYIYIRFVLTVDVKSTKRIVGRGVKLLYVHTYLNAELDQLYTYCSETYSPRTQ